MDVEMEICANCKKEIPQTNYVMHTAHCPRHITLCSICKEPFPKKDIEAHRKRCEQAAKKREELAKKAASPPPPPTRIEQSKYFQTKNTVESAQNKSSSKQNGVLGASSFQQKSTSKKDVSFSFKESSSSVKSDICTGETLQENRTGATAKPKAATSSSSSLLACKYCDLELPKLDLEEHENYCGTRTDKCMECGEIVMFKYKKLHEDSNHGFVKLNDEPGPKPTWDSNTQRTTTSTSEEGYSSSRSRLPAYRQFGAAFDISQYVTFSPASMGFNSGKKEEKKESYKDLSRRLDCKTEYIRNLLHDSASITIPLRTTSTVPRNHFNHNKGPAPQPPTRRRNPPTELVIPCEFCNLPIPHQDLIEHETGCRPDLARFNPRRRLSPGEDDYSMPYVPAASEVPYSPSNTNVDDEELPCEFCSDMIPASQLWRHQMTCN